MDVVAVAHDACGGVDGDVVRLHLLRLGSRLPRGSGGGGFGSCGAGGRSVGRTGVGGAG